MRFLQPTVDFSGIISQSGTISSASHVVTKSWAEANVLNAIHSDSANYAEVVTVGGVKQLKLKPLTITDVSVDTSAATQAAWLSANYSAGTEFQEGDVIILTGTGSTRPETYIHNGGSAGSAADWTNIQGADVQASEVRGFVSGVSGVDYNSSNGQMSLNQAFSRGLMGVSGSGLSYNNSNGQYSLTADTSMIGENGNLYFTDARAQGALSVAGGLLTKSAGQFSLTAGTVRSQVSGAGALSYNAGTGVFEITDSTIRSKISAKAGAILSYNNSTGEVDLTAANIRGQISEASGSLCHYNQGTGEIEMTAADVRGAVSAGGLLSYSGGQFSISAGTVQAQVSASGLLSYSGGAFGLTAGTVRNQISEASGSLCKYNQGTGEIEMAMDEIRKSFSSQALTANTWATITHSLGQKLVHLSAMDNNSKLVDLEVEFIDANSLKVKSAEGVTVDMAISL